MATITLDQLPMDDGYLPAGKWLIAHRDHFSDGIGGARFEAGLSVTPVDGRLLKRFVAYMPIVGAMRIEGAPCEIGDVSRLKPEAPVVPATVVPAVVTNAAQAEAKASVMSAPSTAAELLKLSDAELRKLCTDLEADCSQWQTRRMRRFIADEYGIEGVK